jgi:hypothetical protein
MAKIVNYLFEEALSAEALDFLESSKMHEYDAYDYSKRLMTVMNTPYFMEHIVENSVELGFCDEHILDDVQYETDESKQLDLLNHLRVSIRNYDKKGLSFKELTQLLNTAVIQTKNGTRFSQHSIWWGAISN